MFIDREGRTTPPPAPPCANLSSHTPEVSNDSQGMRGLKSGATCSGRFVGQRGGPCRSPFLLACVRRTLDSRCASNRTLKENDMGGKNKGTKETKKKPTLTAKEKKKAKLAKKQ